jgi:dephospho-CoA kinase
MIIGICGFQSAGKDTIANLLINEYGFKKLSFASALKDIISIMFGWPRDKLEGLTKEDREWRESIDTWWADKLQMPQLTPRYVLQYIATDLFRNHFHPEIWITIVEKQLNQFDNIVITDCRFENEINLLIKYGAKIIKVYRNLPEWFSRYKLGHNVEEAKNLHASEIEWIRCHGDYEITNNGTTDELYEKIKYII